MQTVVVFEIAGAPDPTCVSRVLTSITTIIGTVLRVHSEGLAVCLTILGLREAFECGTVCAS